MPETELKAHLLALARETLQESQTSDSKSSPGREGMTLYDRLAPGQGGRAFYNPMRDDRIIGLPSFAPAVTALEAIPSFLAVADSSEARRIVLQFTYDFLERQTNANFDESAFARPGCLSKRSWQDLNGPISVFATWTISSVTLTRWSWATGLRSTTAHPTSFEKGVGATSRSRSCTRIGTAVAFTCSWWKRRFASLQTT